MGKLGIGLGAFSIILGSHIVYLKHSDPKLGAPLTELVTAPVGNEMLALSEILTDAVQSAEGEGQPALAGLTRAEALRSLGTVRLSVELDDGVQGDAFEIAPNTRLTLTLTNNQIRISAQPELNIPIDFWPDAQLRSLRYDFATASFSADASGFGPDGAYIDAINAAVNGHLKPMLPQVMREAGYQAYEDQQLDQTLQLLIDRLAQRTTAERPEASSLSSTSGVSDPALSVSFVIPQAKQIPLPDSDRSLWVDAGTRVFVSLTTEGELGEASLSALRISFGTPVVVAEEADSAINRMDLRSITVRPDAQLTMEYDLAPEQLVDGAKGLFVLLALLSEPRLAAANPTIESTRLDGIREEIQTKVDEQLEPRLRALILSLSEQTSDSSLADFFGIQSPPSRPGS